MGSEVVLQQQIGQRSRFRRSRTVDVYDYAYIPKLNGGDEEASLRIEPLVCACLRGDDGD